MDVDLDRGAGYGNTLTWSDRDKPEVEVRPVEVQFDLDAQKFYKMFVELLTAPTPPAVGLRSASPSQEHGAAKPVK